MEAPDFVLNMIELRKEWEELQGDPEGAVWLECVARLERDAAEVARALDDEGEP